MPAPLRISSISASDSESQPPLELLIMTPNFSSAKRSWLNFMSHFNRSYSRLRLSPLPINLVGASRWGRTLVFCCLRIRDAAALYLFHYVCGDHFEQILLLL